MKTHLYFENLTWINLEFRACDTICIKFIYKNVAWRDFSDGTFQAQKVQTKMAIVQIAMTIDNDSIFTINAFEIGD
jgi:hypothetical protein